ncbi:MAG: hypothetical protein KIT65_10930 [Xanthobacteraceae bacterium]|nr:hypothetical protein [Xanthobacteraceae bacterium]
MTRKIAIVGANSLLRPMAPFSDPAWEIWTFSPHNLGFIPRFDRWFELHCPFEASVKPFPRYREFLETVPHLTVRDGTCKIPGVFAYPDVEMFDRFGPYFFTSSLAYLMALAITKKPDMIGLWSSTYEPHNPYNFQVPGLRYFATRAAEAGIELYCPKESHALDVPEPYGGRAILEAA